MTQLSLIPVSATQQDRQRKELRKTITRRRRVLERIVVRNEMMRVQLDMLKREYTVKIGSLILKDNHLDLDIIRYRSILSLIEAGKTYTEAMEELAKTYLAEELEFKKEEESIHTAEEILEKAKQHSEQERLELKALWRKLIAMFHPDLVQDPVEKKRRESIMKQINLAYEEGDRERLEKIQTEQTSIEETSIEGLEEVLMKLENQIVEEERDYEMMKQSEWYAWNQKIRRTKKTVSDIFADTEKTLLNSIVEKLDIIKGLKKKIETKQEPSN